MKAFQDVIDIIASFHDWTPIYNQVINELKTYHKDKRLLIVRNFNGNSKRKLYLFH